MKDIVGSDSDVLHTSAFVVVDVLFDLALLATFGWLIDGELDVAVAVGNDLGHEGGVLGGDIFVIKSEEQFEAHHVFVKFDPLVHLAPAYIAYAVIDIFEPYRLCFDFGLGFYKAREEGT